jgi:predicted transcriptional regulator
LRILEEKGHAIHEIDGKRYVYVPSEPKQVAAQSALDQVVRTFFGGSLEGVVRTFLSGKEAQISEEELSRVSKLIENAKRKEGSAS